MQHVMPVVVPLRVEIAPQMVGDVAVVLEHEMDVRGPGSTVARTCAAISSSQSDSVIACTASKRRPSKRYSISQ